VSSREVDSGGRLKEKGAATFEVFSYRGFGVRRLVARGGVPISAEEREKERRRIERRFQEVEKKAAARERRAREGGKKDEPPDPEGPDFTISDVLRASKLANPRRERFRGRNVIVFDFEPDPTFSPKNLFEKLARKVAGAVWIDDEALQVARLEGRLVDSLRFGGGLLGAVKPGPMFVFEQAPVNQEVWLPTYSEFNIAARALFVGLGFNQTVRYANYKRFNVEAEREKLNTPSTVAPARNP
jgi:hypothetical protein